MADSLPAGQLDIAALPKAELHCHIDGLLDVELLGALRAAGHDPGVTDGELARHLPVTSVDRWLKDHAPLAARACTPPDIRLPILLEHHVHRLKRQRVTYAEIFVSSLIGTRSGESELVDLFGDLRRRIDGAAAGAIQVELVICIGRAPRDRVERQFPKIMALHRAGLICGVALAGDEASHRVEPLRDFFARFRDAGMGIEIHAGESCGPESVWDAIEHGVPDRLGHAVTAFGDDRLLAEIARRGIHVEFCPTSNVCLGVVARVEDHPLARAWGHGIEFSINTDDPGPFACSMSSELALVHRVFGYGEAELRRVHQAAMAARFAGR
jgi:adenosine deaminase